MKAMHWNDFAQMLCLGCWFVKDSCVSAVHSYWINWINGYERNEYREMPASMGDGSIANVYFSDAEFDVALYYTVKVMKYLGPEEAKTGTVTVTYSGGTSIAERDRAINMDCNSFARALIFLQEARRTAIPSAKIEKYCSLLECLYALREAHKKQLSETTAAYIGKDSTEQETIRETIRKAYSVRSDRSHGEDLSGIPKQEVERLSRELDEYTRRVFQKVIENGSLNYDTSSEQKAMVRAFFKNIRESVFSPASASTL